MARSAASHLPSSKRMMALVAVTLLIIGLVPVRYLGWVLWVREPVARVMTPLSAPVLSFVAWIAPPEGASADLSCSNVTIWATPKIARSASFPKAWRKRSNCSALWCIARVWWCWMSLSPALMRSTKGSLKE